MSTADHAEVNRRDFLYIATGAMGAVGAALTVWPFIDQMNPDAAVLALASVEVDLGADRSRVRRITVKWRGKPVFIRHRNAQEIEEAKAVPVAELPDPHADNANVTGRRPATTRIASSAARKLPGDDRRLHPSRLRAARQRSDFAVVEGSAKYGGWFCPCHGSHYDTAGPHPQGSGAAEPAVPPYAFVSDTKIRIG